MSFLLAEFKICTLLPTEVKHLIQDMHTSITIKPIVPGVSHVVVLPGCMVRFKQRGGAYWDSFGQRYIDVAEAQECFDNGYYPEFEGYPTYERQFPNVGQCVNGKLSMMKYNVNVTDQHRASKHSIRDHMNQLYRYSMCNFDVRGLLANTVGENCLWYVDLHMVQYDEFWTIQWCPFLSFIGLGNWSRKPLNPSCEWLTEEKAVWNYLDAHDYDHWHTFTANASQYFNYYETSSSDDELDDVDVV